MLDRLLLSRENTHDHLAYDSIIPYSPSHSNDDMAIIEEISSDDDEEQATSLNKPEKRQPLPTQAGNVKSTAEDTIVPGNAVQKLVSNKRHPLQEQ